MFCKWLYVFSKWLYVIICGYKCVISVSTIGHRCFISGYQCFCGNIWYTFNFRTNGPSD